MSLSQAISTTATKAQIKKGAISKIYSREVNLNYLLVTVALYLTATANVSFFKPVSYTHLTLPTICSV